MTGLLSSGFSSFLNITGTSPREVYFIFRSNCFDLTTVHAQWRHAAPTRPSLAGAVAGLVASGIAATLYASSTDDSPLFVATWYPLAIGIVVLAGYVAGSRCLRW